MTSPSPSKYLPPLPMQRGWILVGLLIALGLTANSAGAPPDCPIAEGMGIGGVRVGMPAAAALAVAGPPQRQQAAGTRITYTLRLPWFQMTADDGIVQRVSTRATSCRTARGIGPRSTLAEVRDAYAGASGSVLLEVEGGAMLSYPFDGIEFRLRANRVETVEVFRPDGAVGGTGRSTSNAPGAQTSPRPATASGGATASPPASGTASGTAATGPWNVKTSSARVESAALVVTGTAENRSRAQSVYAEVRAFAPSGRMVASGDDPLYPSPVAAGGTGSFEVRLPIDEVVRRYTVTIRPIGSITTSLAESLGEVKDLQMFVPIVERKLKLDIQVSAIPPSRDDFVLVVTNSSAVTVASATVIIEITGTCRPRAPGAPRPGAQIFREVVSSRAAVEQVRAGAARRTSLQLSAGPCAAFDTWSARPNVTDLTLAE